MKIKKLVSAVSALAMTVSVFAGMAVVGHADSVSQDTHSTSGAITWNINGGSNGEAT